MEKNWKSQDLSYARIGSIDESNIGIKVSDVVGLQFALEAARIAYDSKSQGTPRDIALMTKLVGRGNSHAKALRMVQVYMRIVAPRYWWLEFATYRHGVESCSSSTMHTLVKRDLEQSDFAIDIDASYLKILNKKLHDVRSGAIKIKILKAALPEGFMQERYVMVSYQALRAMYLDRLNHDLPEWRTFAQWIRGLPFSKELITLEEVT